MKAPVSRIVEHLLVLAVVGGLAAATAMAADPVTVKITVTGDAKPGATVTAKATVTVTDGSTFQSIAWRQVGGLTATVSSEKTDTITATLADRKAYREHLIEILGEPPIEETASSHAREAAAREEFFGGLQNRYQVVAFSPFAEEHAAALEFEITVVTSSGTYKLPAEIVTVLPWPWSSGLRNVGAGTPVILCAREQVTYDWALTVPTGSTATLVDPATRTPEFTPDIAGVYKVTITDLTTAKAVTFDVVAGKWLGVIVGQNADGRPRPDSTCTRCHVAGTPLGQFGPWLASGHAEILTQNINDPNGHWSMSCAGCHSVGLDPNAVNGGFDEAAAQDGWTAPAHGDPNNWADMLAKAPHAARLANVQCENCHGPQQGEGHYKGDFSRTSLSSDVCGVCHGEPMRHGRFQQWQLSGHANYELAGEEGTSAGCAMCHSANGFIQWQELGFASNATLNVTWTEDQVHPQTCQSCHDPHSVGTTSGGDTTNATVRLMGDTPVLMAGFEAKGVGKAATCMLCHNSRRGLKNDSTFKLTDATRAPHVPTQADMIMGQNLYFVEVNKPGYHAKVEDSCVACHMDATAPPSDLSLTPTNGTNHAFVASKTMCKECHKVAKAEDVQGPVHAKLATLKGLIEAGIVNVMKQQIALGNKIDLGGKGFITNVADIQGIELVDASGRQAITVTFASGPVGPIGMNNVKVVPPTGTGKDLYQYGPAELPKAGWNYLVIESDQSFGVHNPGWIIGALDASIAAVKSIGTTTGGTDPSTGGGLGNGAGAVACTTPYVYWAEVVARLAGSAGSQWRSDIVARNLGVATANLKFVLHTDAGNVNGTGTVPAAGQGVFEDIVALLGASTKGSLEICSDRPLLVLGRTFNHAATGTFGQFFDGHVADLGLGVGQSVDLLALRQQTGKYRTNINVMNGGTTEAKVAITLFGANGTQLTAYDVTVPAGKIVQDLEPFKNRAGSANVGWGYATVKVTAGSNVRTSASVIDAVTNDPTTIIPKR
jgi:hypothetical protein